MVSLSSKRSEYEEIKPQGVSLRGVGSISEQTSGSVDVINLRTKDGLRTSNKRHKLRLTNHGVLIIPILKHVSILSIHKDRKGVSKMQDVKQRFA